MFDSAMSMFVAPAGVGIFVLVAEYFFIRRAAIPRINPQRFLTIIVPAMVMILGATFGFAVYQMNETRRTAKEIRMLIREQRMNAGYEVNHE